MAKLLEIIGFILVAIMSLGFVGVFKPYGIEPGLSILFWVCSVGALLIIIYRKKKRKQEEKTD
jgi:peptidoglycan biosynthesis protein MviN/MurJ (putative lipid II flippase)